MSTALVGARCLFCGDVIEGSNHLLRCDGRQGHIEAAAFTNYRAPSVPYRETSVAAARSIEPTAVSLCGRVLEAIRATREHGLTCDDVKSRLGLSHQTGSARIWDLHRRDLICDSGKRRPSATGRASIVWIAI